MLVDNWKTVLRRSATVWLSAASQVLFIMAGAVYVFADELGDWQYIALVGGLAVAGFVCVSIIPLARIVKQPKLHNEDC